MSEKYPRPTNADKVGFRTSGTPSGPSTDPGTAIRANGWANGYTLPAAELNFMQELRSDMIQWCENMSVREWTDISEGVANTSVRDLFRVGPPASGDLYSRLYLRYTTATTITGVTAPKDLHTDGEQLYYFGGTSDNYFVVADAADMSEVAEVNAGYAIVALAADGEWVWYSSSSASHTGLRRYNRDGTTPATAGTKYDYTKLASNGSKVVGISPNGDADGVDIYTAATPALDGTCAPGCGSPGLRAVAIDASQCYVGGNRNTYDVWAYNLSTRAEVWKITLPGSTPVVNSIVTDGDFVYVGTDYNGSTGSIFCLRRTDGTLLWTINLLSSVNTDQLAVDSNYLYAIDGQATPDMYVISLRYDAVGPTTAPWVDIQSNKLNKTYRICCDGVSVFGAYGSTVRRLDCGYPTRTFLRVNGDDPQRRPFYTLAMPAD